DEEIARQWDEEERKRARFEAKTSKKIDWNDPSVLRYHALKMKPKRVAQARRNMIKYLKNQGNYKISDFKGMSYNEIRPIFEKVWDFNQHIEPMEHGSGKMKSPEKIEEKDVDAQKEVKEVVKESGAKRKKSLPRKRRTIKRQKLEEDAEKEELKGFFDIIPKEEFAEDVESLSIKFPIVDWKTCVLTENFMYYQIFKGDGSSKNYKVLSEMLEDFDRQDVEELYRLVKERYSASRPEGYDLMLLGDLHTLFEPDKDDEIWKNQHEYNGRIVGNKSSQELILPRRTIDQSAGGKLRDLNAEESWALLEDLALYDNESWNDPRDFAKPVKAISLPQDVPINKITTSCEICSGPHDTQYCIENPEQGFVEYASSRTDEAGVLSARSYPTEDSQCSTHIHNSINAITIHPKQPEESQDNEPDVGQEEKGNLGNINSNPHSQPDPLASIAIEQVQKLNLMLESIGLVP
ncbi:hypothetical protein Tco_0753416, partial [Tanacetum coccineum]